MKTLPRLSAKLFRSPLLLEESTRKGLESSLLAHMGRTEQKASDWFDDDDEREPKELFQRFGSVAVISIHGVLDKRISMLEEFCYGACNLERVDEALGQAAEDATITRVVLDVHSPGGSVTGVPETAQRIAEMRKEVHAFVACQACSGAQWLISQADVIVANPSASVGSIGVYMALLDQTRALEMEGLAVNLIRSGDYKAAGASFKKLTDSERALFQAQCDRIYEQFKAAVRANHDVADETMQGQTFSAEEGSRLGLVDRLTIQTLDEYVNSLLTVKR